MEENCGNIPGFYWDEEKKKYFKILADHLLPTANVKYSKSNVKQERRLSKKRKTEERQQQRLAKNTIQLPPVLKAPAIGGIGLLREHATSSKFQLHASTQRDFALVSQWEPEHIAFKPPGSWGDRRLQDAHFCPPTDKMVIATTFANNSSSQLYACDFDSDDTSESRMLHFTSAGIAAFNSNTASISTGAISGSHVIMGCAEFYQHGNVFIGKLPARDDEEVFIHAGLYITPMPSSFRLSDSAICEDSAMAVISDIAANVTVLDLPYGKVVSHSKRTAYCESNPPASHVNWIDPRTVLYGGPSETKNGYSVKLWDVRIPDGIVERFRVRDKLTSIFNPLLPGSYSKGSPHEIIVSSNHRIDLFDVRMPKFKTTLDPFSNTISKTPNANGFSVPILSIPHVHGGPRLQTAAGGALLAAVDRDNIVQVYSTRTGTKVRSLTAPAWQPKMLESPMLRKLMWVEDNQREPILQAVRGMGILRWRWGGGRNYEDEDEEY